MNLKKAIASIEKRGALLVFPISNQKEPPSLWSEFFPKSQMRWEWDESGDARVADLWHLREELSRSGKVAYAKWFRGRATFFSLPVFEGFIARLNTPFDWERSLGREAKTILQLLEEESPQSSKELKRSAVGAGLNAKTYDKHLRELWSRLWVVGFGEVDDGAFPSLAIGSTRSLHEASWKIAMGLNFSEANQRIAKSLASESPFVKYISKVRGAGPKSPTKRVYTYEELTGGSRSHSK